MAASAASAWLGVFVVSLASLWGARAAGSSGGVQSSPPDGASLYKERCASCHDTSQERTPPRSILATRRPEEIVASLTTGTMRTFASGLAETEIRALAVHLTGKEPDAAAARTGHTDRCQTPAGAIDLNAPHWNGWGKDLDNTRYQPAPGLSAEDVPRLRLKWAYAYPTMQAIGQPTVVGDRLYVSTGTGHVVSLNARTGCTYWTIDVGASVRTAITIGALPAGGPAKFVAYFGDVRAYVHAVDAETGKALWKLKADDHPVARITGSPVLHGRRLYVPVSSFEEFAAQKKDYECCTFRGSLVAIDASTGTRIWKTYSIPDQPKPYRKTTEGTQLHGPAGGAIWGAPTPDPKRGVIYAGTGNSYTDVPVGGADAIIAFDLETGRIRWVNQIQAGDNFIVSCMDSPPGNCPQTPGPDFDFGSSTILRRLPNGADVLLAGQKSGILFALDPDNGGRILWQTTLGGGSPLGGIEWGFAADAGTAYVPMADALTPPERRKPGLSAVTIATGNVLWHTPAPAPACAWGAERCNNAQSAAVSAIPGVVFAGTTDGHLRAYAAADGRIIWNVDTAAAPYAAVNGGQARGGSIDAGGPTVANGMLYINSGYGLIVGRPGNALLAFSVDGK
jgi:polyvinyl alcohol dehydrogenase (cytochrome)